MKNYPEFEKKIQAFLSPILVLALVSITSFILGENYQRQNTPVQSAVEDTVGSTASVIDELKETINTQTSASETKPIVAQKININSASLSELDSLPGIGPAYAQAIINYRNQNGPFVSIEDLEKVRGIGPKTLDKLRDQITI